MGVIGVINKERHPKDSSDAFFCPMGYNYSKHSGCTLGGKIHEEDNSTGYSSGAAFIGSFAYDASGSGQITERDGGYS